MVKLLNACRTVSTATGMASGGGAEQEGGTSHSYPLTVLEGAATHLTRIDKRTLPMHMYALVRLLFLPHEGDPPHALRA